MFRIRIIIILLLTLKISFGQKPNISSHGNNKVISFEEYIMFVEASSSYFFYYEKDWIKDLQVNTSDTILSVEEVLSGMQFAKSLNYIIDSGKNIVLYQGKEISGTIPNFRTIDINSESLSANSKIDTNKAEKRYIKGLQIVDLELIEVGNSQKTVAGKKSIISGTITDEDTGEPLIGATLYIKDLEIGCATDLDGHFSIALETGKYLVEANSLSMKKKSFYIQVNDNGSLSIPLKRELISINEVTVVSDQMDNVRGMQMGFERLTTKSIKEIPVVMGEKDLLKIAQMLPGVQSSGEGASGLNVRGGTADQNLFYINKMPVYNTSHLFGFFTAFSPDIVSNFSLYKSNIPAKFGGRVSSVFDILTRQGNKKEFFAQGGISPITGHIAVEGPIIKDKVSFVLSLRSSYSDWILSKMNDENLKNSKASFNDFSAIINAKLNDKNIIKLFAYNSNDRFSLALTDDYKYSNVGGSIIWKHFFSTSLSSDISAVISDYRFGHNSKSNPSEAYSQDYRLNHNEIKIDLNYTTKYNHRIAFGASSILYKLNRGNILPYNSESMWRPIYLGEEQGLESALYITDEFPLFPRLNIQAGFRYSFYSQLGPAKINEYFSNTSKDRNNINEELSFTNNEIIKTYSGPEPRVALNFNLGNNNSVKASYNRTRQYIFMLSNTISISPTDQWKLADYHIIPPVSDQISVGYYQDFPKKGLSSSVEVYVKRTQNIIEYKDGVDFISDNPPEMLLLQGNQNGYGIEYILKKSSGNITGWLSYCYSSSVVQVNNTIASENINNGKRYPSNFDRPHSFSLVSNIRSNRRLSFSTNIVYSTGRPITYPITSYYSEGQQVFNYSERNKYRIPDYFRIDFSINLEGNLLSDKWIHSHWMLNVYNLTGRKNAYSVYFEAEDGVMKGYKLSVFGQPIITLSWNFKFGNYASE